MEHSTNAPNERVLRTTQLAKLSFNHPSVVFTADVSIFLIKYGDAATSTGILHLDKIGWLPPGVV